MTCGKLSACQKNEQRPIKRSSDRQTNWKRRHLAVLHSLPKRNRPARTSARPLCVVAVLRRRLQSKTRKAGAFKRPETDAYLPIYLRGQAYLRIRAGKEA